MEKQVSINGQLLAGFDDDIDFTAVAVAIQKIILNQFNGSAKAVNVRSAAV